MKVLLTGAPGFLGLNIAKSLAEAGHETTALVRSTSRTDYLQKFDVRIEVCDLRDREGLLAACRGMEGVIHCAAFTSNFAKDAQAVFETNVNGTRNVVEAALASGVRRFVHTGTTSTIGYNEDGTPADEELPVSGFRAESPYSQSKVAAERIVLDAVPRGLRAVILSPAEIVGPYDYHFGWGSFILALKKGEAPFIPSGGASFCHSEEVARTHREVLCDEKGRVGERYILAGTDAKLKTFYETVCRVADCPMPSMNIPYFMIRTLFALKENLHPLLPLPPVDGIRLRTWYKDIYFSSKKAEKELGYRARPLGEMVEEAHDWYRDNGYL